MDTKEKSPLHIAFCAGRNYIRYAAVTIKSIVENNRGCDIRIHILSEKLPASIRRRLNEAAAGNGDTVRLHIYEVDDTELRGLKLRHWTIYAWYRLLLPETLSAEITRVLYLDVDIVVAAGLQELFELDLTGKSIAAPFDVQSLFRYAFDRCGYEPHKKYVCAGVLLMNLDYWREHRLTRQIIDWARANHARLAYPDQDAINYICRETKIVLPFRFNVYKYYLTGDLHTRPELFDEIRDCAYRPAIIHYAGYYPWVKFCATHPMQAEWEKYNRMLRHPVRSHYVPRRWLLVKQFVWRLVHPFDERSLFRKGRRLTLEEVKRRLEAYDS